MVIPFTINRLARVAWLTFVTATKPKIFQHMIGPERLAIVLVHFAALAERVLLQVDIIHRLELLIQLWNALTLHTTTTLTRLVTATCRPAPAKTEDFTSTAFQRMVKRNDQFHPNECFPPHRQHLVVIIIFTQMVEILHRLLHLPIKSITVAGEIEIVRWLHEQSRCHVTYSPTEHMALAYVSRAEEKRVIEASTDLNPLIPFPFLNRHRRVHLSNRRRFCSRTLWPPTRRHHTRS